MYVVTLVLTHSRLFSDEEIASYKRTPFLNLDERRLSALSCRYVDRVCTGIPIRSTKIFADYYGFDFVVRFKVVRLSLIF